VRAVAFPSSYPALAIALHRQRIQQHLPAVQVNSQEQ